MAKNLFFVKKGRLGEGKRRGGRYTVFFGPYGLAYMLLNREVGLVLFTNDLMMLV